MKFRATALVAIALAPLYACSSDKPVEALPPAISSLQAATQSVSIARGSAQSILFVIGRRADFERTVNMTVEKVPTGVTASFGPASLAFPAANSLLNITVGPNAEAGNYTLTVRASALQVDSRTADVALTVTVPSMTVSATGEAALLQGGSTTIPVTVSRGGGFTGSVTLFTAGLPAGITATFSPVVLLAGETQSTMTLTAGLTLVVTAP